MLSIVRRIFQVFHEKSLRLSTCILTSNATPPQLFFKYFASENQLPGFYIKGTLVKNGLIGIQAEEKSKY